jgi:hypothetical protein
MYTSRIVKTSIAAAGLCLATWGSMAQANIISGTLNDDFTNGGATLNLSNPNNLADYANYSFIDNGNGVFSNPVSVKTSGGGRFAFVLGQPTSYFTGSRAPYIDGNLLANFKKIHKYTPIFGSGTDSYLPIALNFNDGRHYGYIHTDGTELISFGFQSVAGQGIQAGTMSPGQGPMAVPEPASIGLLAFALGLIGFGFAVRHRRNTQHLI